MIETNTVLPPLIKQYFHSILLSLPTPKFCDDDETLWKIYLLLKKQINKKRFNKDILLSMSYEKEFLEIYERIMEKKKEFEAKTGKEKWKPFYYITFADRRRQQIFDRLRRGSLEFSFKLREYNEI